MLIHKKIEIVLCVVVVLGFIIPTGIIAADKDPLHGGGSPTERPNTNQYKEEGYVIDPSLAVKYKNDIVSQTGDVSINGFGAANPKGQFIQVSTGDVIPIEDYYSLYCKILNTGPCSALIKPHLELYKLDSSPDEIIMYETSFEDNSDIYNNWVQIDGDCAFGGFYDSFSWTDKRSSEGTHSMKSTMYDTYKGNQDDFLMFTKTFDISDQDAVNFTFDIWVEGQYGDWYTNYFGESMYTPLDFLDFEIFDGGCWYNPYYERSTWWRRRRD